RSCRSVAWLLATLGNRWRLPLDARQGIIDTRPTRRGGRPDRGAGLCDLWIIQSTAANEHQVRTRLRFAEDRRAAFRTETPMHDVAAVSGHGEIGQLALHGQRAGGEAGVHGGVTGRQVLTYATPTKACRERCSGKAIAHRLAQTTTCYFHSVTLTLGP